MKTFEDFVNEAKTQQGAYYVLELPRSNNNFQIKIASGPHRTRMDAERSGGAHDKGFGHLSDVYGWNQDKAIAILDKGRLMTVNYSTGKATDTPVSNMVGIANVEQHLGLK